MGDTPRLLDPGLSEGSIGISPVLDPGWSEGSLSSELGIREIVPREVLPGVSFTAGGCIGVAALRSGWRRVEEEMRGGGPAGGRINGSGFLLLGCGVVGTAPRSSSRLSSVLTRVLPAGSGPVIPIC